MLADLAVSTIIGRLGQRTGLDAWVLAELGLAQAEAESDGFLPWFLETVDKTTLQTPIGPTTDFLDLAGLSGFLREREDQSLYVQTVPMPGQTTSGPYSAIGLRKRDLSILWDDRGLVGDYTDPQSQISSQSSNILQIPTYYAMVGTKAYFRPIPDQTYQLWAIYYKADAAPALGQTNKWLTFAPGYLVAQAGIRIARYLREQGAMMLFGQDLQEARARLVAAHTMQSEAGRGRSLTNLG